jgi:hypothetical protein
MYGTYDDTGKGESREFIILSMQESSIVDLPPDRIRIQWGPWIWIIRISNPNPGSGRTKMAHKNRKVIISFFGSAGCSLFKAEGFL